MKNVATCVAILAALAIHVPLSAQGDELITVSSTTNQMRAIDPVTFVTLRTLTITTSNSVTAAWCNGLAFDAATSQLYIIVRETGTTVRKLGILNPATAVATIMGTLPDAFSGLSFRSDGVLFGVTGDGANVPESLYTINPATAQATFVLSLGNGDDGEAIAFAPDGFLYHCSGLGTPNVDEIFERIDTFSNTVTPITRTGYDYSEILSLTSWVGGNLLACDYNDELMAITTAGHATYVSTTNGPNAASFVKGAAFVPAPATQTYLRTYGYGCTLASTTIPILASMMTGTVASGLTAHVDLVLAPPGVAGVLGLGFSNQSIPVPSPTCQVQISPLGPDLTYFTTSPTGTFSFVVPIPAGFPTGDIYGQIAVVEGSAIVLTNPFQAHFP